MQSKHVREKITITPNIVCFSRRFIHKILLCVCVCVLCVLYGPKRRYEKDMYDVRVQNTQSTQQFCLCNNIQVKNKINTDIPKSLVPQSE